MQGWKEDPIQSPLADGDHAHTKKMKAKMFFFTYKNMTFYRYNTFDCNLTNC